MDSRGHRQHHTACADVVQRDSTAELLVAEKIATGYVRVGGPTTTQRFTATGAFVKD